MDVLVGYFGRLYMHIGSPPEDWLEVDRARDVLVRMDSEPIDFPVRNRDRFSTPRRGIKYTSLEFSVLYDPEKQNAVNTALRRAYWDETIISFFAADGQLGAGDGYDAEGVKGEYYIRSASVPQRINRVVFTTYIAVPAGEAETTPSWHTE